MVVAANTSCTKHEPFECVNCHRPMSADLGVVPHFIADGTQSTKSAEGEGKMEAWCPICFVMKRAHVEVMERGHARYAPHIHRGGKVQGSMRAIKCGKCGVESLAHGHSGCIHCGETRVVKTLAEPHYAVVLAGAKNPEEAVRKDPVAAAVAAGKLKDNLVPSKDAPVIAPGK